MSNAIVMLTNNGFVEIKPSIFNDRCKLRWYVYGKDLYIVDDYAISVDGSGSVTDAIYSMQYVLRKTLRKLCINSLEEVHPAESLESIGIYSSDIVLKDVVHITMDNLPDCPGTTYRIWELYACPLLHMFIDETDRLFSGYKMTDSLIVHKETGAFITRYDEAAEILSRKLSSSQVRSCLSHLLECFIR